MGFLFRRGKRGQPPPSDGKPESPYEALRQMALRATPALASFDTSSTDRTVYGAVLDWGFDGYSATAFALFDGTASLYLSTGGGVIGGHGHDWARSAGVAFICAFEPFVATMNSDPGGDLPPPGSTDLRALTTRGRLVVRATTDQLSNRQHPMAPVWMAGQELIAALRASTEDPKHPPQVLERR